MSRQRGFKFKYIEHEGGRIQKACKRRATPSTPKRYVQHEDAVGRMTYARHDEKVRELIASGSRNPSKTAWRMR